MEPDTYNIWVSKPERTVVALDSFKAVAGSNRAADMTLISGGIIEGRLIDRNGEPVGGTASDPYSDWTAWPVATSQRSSHRCVLVEKTEPIASVSHLATTTPMSSSAGIAADRDPGNVFDLPPVTVKEGATVTLDFQIASPVRLNDPALQRR